jgi:hypothetical protein
LHVIENDVLPRQIDKCRLAFDKGNVASGTPGRNAKTDCADPCSAIEDRTCRICNAGRQKDRVHARAVSCRGLQYAQSVPKERIFGCGNPRWGWLDRRGHDPNSSMTQ